MVSALARSDICRCRRRQRGCLAWMVLACLRTLSRAAIVADYRIAAAIETMEFALVDSMAAFPAGMAQRRGTTMAAKMDASTVEKLDRAMYAALDRLDLALTQAREAISARYPREYRASRLAQAEAALGLGQWASEVAAEQSRHACQLAEFVDASGRADSWVP